MNITVKKLTDVELLRKANSFTTGRDSHMSLATAYRNQHSPCRTQMFWIECSEIPLFVASQLVRQHVGVQFFQRSKRPDRNVNALTLEQCCEATEDAIRLFRGNGNYDNLDTAVGNLRHIAANYDRKQPTSLAFIANAEALINMAHKRLCRQASKETREIVEHICALVGEQDPDLERHLVPQCVYRGGICPEPKCCGFIKSDLGRKTLEQYILLFVQ